MEAEYEDKGISTRWFSVVLLVAVLEAVALLLIAMSMSRPPSDPMKRALDNIALYCRGGALVYSDDTVVAGSAYIDIDRGRVTFKCYDFKTEYRPWEK